MADISISRPQTAHPAGDRCGAHGRADWLGLAGAPAFAVMALVTVASARGEPDWLCSAAHGGSLLNPMVTMYLLMSVFHARPWLKVILCR